MELCWIDNDGHECVPRFQAETEARQCADGLQTRGLQNLQLFDNDGEPQF